jgi:HlyD family secretion protein
MTRFLTWLIVVVAIVGISAWVLRPRAVLVDAAYARVGPMHVALVHEGRTRVEDRYVVRAPLSGVVQRILLKEGDSVVAGVTELAIIEPASSGLLDERALASAEARVRSAEASQVQAESGVTSARAGAEQARSEYARVDRLVEGGGSPLRELEVARREATWWASELRGAEAAVEVARSEVEWARAGLTQAQPSSGEAQPETSYPVVAPIHGTVLRVQRKSAGPVAAQEALIELGDLSRMELVADYLSTDAVRMEPGMPARIVGWGGEQVLSARVRRIEPSGFTKVSALGVEEQRVNVVLDLLPPEEGTEAPPLGDGFRVEVEVLLWQADAVLNIPEGALFRDADGAWAVFVASANQAHLQQVEVGHRDGLHAEILNGLNEDDLVVLYPGDAVHEGTPLESRVR